MAELVTMVFTDLVSSTAVKQKMPGRDLAERNARFFDEILGPHRQRVEESLAEASGRVVSTQGDGYFLVFTDLLLAIHWSVALQRSHQQEPIPTPLGDVEVKISIHVGSPLLDGNNFIGHEVDYAARIGALCRGGQILVSQAVASLLRDARMEDFNLHAHGDHTLKGVGSVPIYEVLYDRRPPVRLKPEYVPPVELPPLPDLFFEREELSEQLNAALHKGGAVILRGQGGMGKTTLALTAAHRLRGQVPVAWLDGERAPTLEDCLRDVAAAFWGDPQDDVEPQEVRRRLQEYAEVNRALIVLDNFETVAQDAVLIRWISSFRAPAQLIVTTREVPNGLRGTVIGIRELSRDEAVRLFCDRVRMSGGEPPADLKVVHELCEVVGDSPLAVELLAGRAARLPLTRLRDRLRQSLSVLDAGNDVNRPGRHQSIQACFALSYDILSPLAQKLLSHLAVWPDGIGLELLHTALTDPADWDDVAEELVAASLWRLDGERYDVHPLVRQYALEQLGDQRTAVAMSNVANLARIAAAKGRFLPTTAQTARAAALAWFDEEWANLLTAVDLACEHQAWPELVALADSVVDYWDPRGLARDVENVYNKALTACRELHDSQGEARIQAILERVRKKTWDATETADAVSN